MKDLQILLSDDKTKVEFAYASIGSDIFDPMRLLAEWYNWWSEQDIPPSKMPNSLHTRTAMVLSQKVKSVEK